MKYIKIIIALILLYVFVMLVINFISFYNLSKSTPKSLEGYNQYNIEKFKSAYGNNKYCTYFVPNNKIKEIILNVNICVEKAKSTSGAETVFDFYKNFFRNNWRETNINGKNIYTGIGISGMSDDLYAGWKNDKTVISITAKIQKHENSNENTEILLQELEKATSKVIEINKK